MGNDRLNFKAVEKSVKSQYFWAYSAMLRALHGALSDFQTWAESCPCHCRIKGFEPAELAQYKVTLRSLGLAGKDRHEPREPLHDVCELPDSSSVKALGSRWGAGRVLRGRASQCLPHAFTMAPHTSLASHIAHTMALFVRVGRGWPRVFLPFVRSQIA